MNYTETLEKISDKQKFVQDLFITWAKLYKNKRANFAKSSTFYQWVKKEIGSEEYTKIKTDLFVVWHQKVEEGILVKKENSKNSFRLNY